MTPYTVRRTFAAKLYPKGSPERASLNEQPETSEYYSSMPFLAVYEIAGQKSTKCFRTRKEAKEYLA